MTNIKKHAFVQHLTTPIICEENSINSNGNKVISGMYQIIRKDKKKMEKPPTTCSKPSKKGMPILHKVYLSRRKVFLEPQQIQMMG